MILEKEYSIIDIAQIYAMCTIIDMQIKRNDENFSAAISIKNSAKFFLCKSGYFVYLR